MIGACAPTQDGADDFDFQGGIQAIISARPGFFFYPPLAPEPNASGTFLSELLPRLRVELERTDASGVVAVAGAWTSPSLSVSTVHQRYLLRLRLADWFTDPSASYRFRVLLDGRELGVADMPAQVFGFIERYPEINMTMMFRIEPAALDRDGDGISDGDDHCPDHADPANPIPTDEVCDGLDNNCGGDVDEGCLCVHGAVQACYTGAPGTENVGLCRGGSQTCMFGAWGECAGEVVPANRALASSSFVSGVEGWSIDNDGENIRNAAGTLVVDDVGDGRIWYFVAPAAFTGDLSAMYGGTLSYRQTVSHNNIDAPSDAVQIYGANGVVMQIGTAEPTTSWTSYVVRIEAGAWTNAANDDVLGEAELRAVLANVTRLRIRGEYSNTRDTGSLDDVSLTPAAELCDGLDNDCDGAVDEESAIAGNDCATGLPGMCSAGTLACNSGVLECVQDSAPGVELCDGYDNSCDGVTDEGCDCINGQTRSCYEGPAGTSGVGICDAGMQTCVDGHWAACSGQVLPEVEACDGVDNNCDARTDESCAIVESHFDSSIEGWSYEGDGSNPRLTSGAFTISDTGAGIVWYFLAPAAYRGDLSAAYGGRLNYRFRVSTRNSTGITDSVQITGGNGMTMQIATALPTTTFSQYSIPIVAGSWVNASGGAVLSEAQIRAILANVTRLRIRGEYSNALDVGYLDDVVLTRPQ